MTREEAINNLESLYNEVYNEDSDGYTYAEAIDMAIEALQTDAIQGVWVIRENGNKECSLCRHERQDGWDYFCGYCGAKMKGGAE